MGGKNDLKHGKNMKRKGLSLPIIIILAIVPKRRGNSVNQKLVVQRLDLVR